jgi:hypothetical protein
MSRGAQVVQVVEIVKAFLYRFRHRDGFGIGEGAVVASRATDHVGQRADIGRRQPERYQGAPQIVERVAGNIGEHQVLLVCCTDFTE